MASKERPGITFVVGARPNIIKVDPLIRAANVQGLDWRLVHTGQHYDYQLSQGLFDALGTPNPHLDLLEHLKGEGIHLRNFSRGERFGLIATYFGQYCKNERPDMVVVVGDVDSTVACAMAAKMSGVRVAHVEAGCRSGERSPEELNRIVVDEISDYLYLRTEGDNENVNGVGVVVGDPAIDTLMRMISNWSAGCTPDLKGHILLTLHRPENVDTPARLDAIMTAIRQLSIHRCVIFPVHPRTYKNLKRDMVTHHTNLDKHGYPAKIIATPPLDYLHMIRLMRGAALVITDSGGMQLDTSYLGVPCVTVRRATEHHDTVDHGTNVLAYTAQEILNAAYPISEFKVEGQRQENPLWDGQAAVRIIDHIKEMI